MKRPTVSSGKQRRTDEGPVSSDAHLPAVNGSAALGKSARLKCIGRQAELSSACRARFV